MSKSVIATVSSPATRCLNTKALLVYEASWPGAEICFRKGKKKKKKKNGSGCIFLSESCLGLSLGHLVINLSSPGPSALGLARGALLEATAGALCSQGAQPASGARAGLRADRSAHRGSALKSRPPRRKSVWLTPLCPSPGPTQCPQRRSPSGKCRGPRRADALLEDFGCTGRRSRGRASGTGRVCAPGVRATRGSPHAPLRLPGGGSPSGPPGSWAAYAQAARGR